MLVEHCRADTIATETGDIDRVKAIDILALFQPVTQRLRGDGFVAGKVLAVVVQHLVVADMNGVVLVVGWVYIDLEIVERVALGRNDRSERIDTNLIIACRQYALRLEGGSGIGLGPFVTSNDMPAPHGGVHIADVHFADGEIGFLEGDFQVEEHGTIAVLISDTAVPHNGYI